MFQHGTVDRVIHNRGRVADDVKGPRFKNCEGAELRA